MPNPPGACRMVKKLIFASEKGGVPDRRLMPLPAHSTSADHPVVPCNAQFRGSRSLLDSARETAIGSACPGDCAPRGNVPSIVPQPVKCNLLIPIEILIPNQIPSLIEFCGNALNPTVLF